MKTTILATESLGGRIITTPAAEPTPTAEAAKPAGVSIVDYLMRGGDVTLEAACESAGLTVAQYESVRAKPAEGDNSLSGIVAYYERQGLTNAQARRAAGLDP